MANVIKLINGGAIQVRTGVLAGVGPVGPRGPRGNVGPEGPQGPDGPDGPQGGISQYQARANWSANTSVAASTATIVAFGSVAYDDMSVFASSTNMSFSEEGDYMISAYVKFAEPAGATAGTRELRVYSLTNTTTMWFSSVNATALDDVTYVSIAYPHRVLVADEVMQIRVFQGDNESMNITGGAVVVTRMGSGAQGLRGVQGIQGPIGLTGPTGPTGATGSAGDGYATYGEIDGA